MPNGRRATCVVFFVVLAGVLAPERAQAQAGVKPPMPPDLFTTTKLNDHLYVIAPSGPDMSNVGGNIGVCISDQGVLLVDANYYDQLKTRP
jgi:hypothetical protein